MKGLHIVEFILVIVGGLNWGLIGLASFMGGMDWNVVHMLVGSWPSVESLVYVLVGLSAVHLMIAHKSACRECEVSGSGMRM